MPRKSSRRGNHRFFSRWLGMAAIGFGLIVVGTILYRYVPNLPAYLKGQAVIPFQGGVYVAASDITGDGTPDIVTGAGAGGGPHVKVFDGVTNTEVRSFYAYDRAFTGGARVATGDVTGDGRPDVITAPGPGGSPHVKVFDGVTNAEVRSFFAYDVSVATGVFIAAGDMNRDGRADIITGADRGGGPHVKVFDGLTGNELRSFFAYDRTFNGGVRIAAGDVNRDGVIDIITSAGPGGPHIKVFNGATGGPIREWLAYDSSFQGGVYVAAGDITGDGTPDVITGAGESGSSHVKVFDGVTNAEVRGFFAYDRTFTGGVRVASTDYNRSGLVDIVTGAGPGGGPHVKVFDGSNVDTILRSFFAYVNALPPNPPNPNPSPRGGNEGFPRPTLALPPAPQTSLPPQLVAACRAVHSSANNEQTGRNICSSLPCGPFQSSFCWSYSHIGGCDPCSQQFTQGNLLCEVQRCTVYCTNHHPFPRPLARGIVYRTCTVPTNPAANPPPGQPCVGESCQ